RSVTPCRALSASRVIVSPICISETSCSRESGMSFGSASMFSSRVTCSFTHARGLINTGQLEHDRRLDGLVKADPEQIDVHGLACHRVTGELLHHHGSAAGAVHAQIQHRPGVLEGQPELARVDLEGNRILATAVHDAGHVALTAQAPDG